MNTSKWTLDTRKKLKLTLGLVLMTGLLFLANAFEKEQMTSMDQSFLSIYEDRLVPAVSIFEMRELMYHKRETLQEMLESGMERRAALQHTLDSCNQEIGELLSAYKKTYFLGNETDCLRAFESNLRQYNHVEQHVAQLLFAGNSTQGSQDFTKNAAPSFKTAVLKLSQLSHIQSEIGKGMLSDSKKAVSSYLVLSNLETVLIVLSSVVAHFLIYTTRSMMRRRMEPFNMN
jgi:hypothetical protein